MKFIKIVLSPMVLFILLLSSCVNEPTGDKGYGLAKARVIVLCDVSNSVTLLSSQNDAAGQLDKLKYYIGKIPGWYEFGSEISYYPVSDNLVSRQLGSPVSYNIINNSDIDPEKTKVDSLVNELRRMTDSIAPITKNSCILLSIRRATDRLKEMAGEGEKMNNELIIISDMVENCRVSDSTEIRMSLTNANALNKAIQQFENENPRIQVADLGLKVRVIINSPWVGNKFQVIKDAWQSWFIKIGVKPESLSFYTDEPPYKENPLLHKF